MAKELKAEKIKRQQKTTEQYGNQRLKIKAERDYASLAMLPRDASVVSPQNRGWISGRPPGQRRRYGRVRVLFRKLTCQSVLSVIRNLLPERTMQQNCMNCVLEQWNQYEEAVKRRAVQNRRITELQKLIGEVPVAQPSDRQFIDTCSRKAEAESRRMAMNCELMVIERNIKLFHTTLSSLDKPVCPISDQLVCSTDKTDVREEVSAALQNNHLLRSSLKERIESQNTIIQECIAEEQNYVSQKAAYEQYRSWITELDIYNNNLTVIPPEPIV